MPTTSPIQLSIERSANVLTITMRTHRSGDSVHYVFGVLATISALLVLLIAVTNGTLFESSATIPLVLAGLGYGWFALTRVFNLRVAVVSSDDLHVTVGPLPTLASGFEIPVASIGKISTREERRWAPLLQWNKVSHVEAAGSPKTLFASVTTDEATRIRAAMVSFLAST